MDRRRKKWWLHPLDLDEQSLEFEWWRQAKLVQRWGVKQANARKEVNEAKASLELVEAKLRLAINKDPGSFGLETKTIPMVDAAIVAHPKYAKAVRRHDEARHNLDVISAMVSALDHKKKALESDSDFYMAGFFSEPRSRGVSEISKRRARRAGRERV